MAQIHSSLLHPLTGEPIVPVYIDRNGRARFPIMGGAPDGDDGGEGGADGGTDGGDSGDGGTGDGDAGGKDLGYPQNTPVSQMTADQKAAYFEEKARKEESRRKGLSKAVGGKTADQIAADLAELEQLRAGSLSDQQKAVKDAADAARAEERVKAGQRIAKATFEGALGHLKAEDRNEILDGVNLARYIDDDGEVDTEKVRAYAARIAPVDTTRTRQRDFGAGVRAEGVPARGAGGKAEAERRFGKKSTSTAGA